MKRHIADSQGLGTGARLSRDLAQFRKVCTSRDGYIVGIDWNSPIDAPDTVPAGACVNTDYQSWNGSPLVSQATFKR